MNRIVAAGRGAYLIVERGGRTGAGECAPLPGRSPDRLDACLAALARAEAVADIPPGLPAARFALETALLGGEIEERGVSLAEVLSPVPVAELAASALASAARQSSSRSGERPASGAHSPAPVRPPRSTIR